MVSWSLQVHGTVTAEGFGPSVSTMEREMGGDLRAWLPTRTKWVRGFEQLLVLRSEGASDGVSWNGNGVSEV